MKWGVRKKRAPIKTSSDYKKTAPLRKRKTPELTNKQLKAVNERINLEQNYNRMNPSTVKRGTVAAASILDTAQIGVTAYNMLNSPAAKAAKANAKRALKTQPRRGQQQLFF